MGVVREEAARAEATLVVEKGVEDWAAGAAAAAMAVVGRVAEATVAAAGAGKMTLGTYRRS